MPVVSSVPCFHTPVDDWLLPSLVKLILLPSKVPLYLFPFCNSDGADCTWNRNHRPTKIVGLAPLCGGCNYRRDAMEDENDRARKDVANVEFDCKVTAVRYSNAIEIAGAEHAGRESPVYPRVPHSCGL